MPPELVGAWKLSGGETVITFLFDGTYYLVDGSGPRPGMERGHFSIVNKNMGKLTVKTLKDTNGEAGLSHPNGDAFISVSFDNDTFFYTVSGEGSFTFTRIKDATRPEVGSWFIPAEKCMLTLLADGTYYMCQEMNDAPYAYDGIERGTYSWNSTTKSFSATPVVDTNGDIGLSHQSPNVTADFSTTRMTMTEGSEQYHFQPILANPELMTRMGYELGKYISHRQTSEAAPVAESYMGAVYVYRISDTGGTLTIGNQPPRNLDGDELEVEFPSLEALNAPTGFPAGVNHVLHRFGGSATLVFPVETAFPAAPHVHGEEGTWNGGTYTLGQGDLLEWTAFENFNPETDLTVITVRKSGEDDYIYDHFMPGNVTSFDFEGRLDFGPDYRVSVQHVRVADVTLPGTTTFGSELGYALLNSETKLTIHPHQHTPAGLPIIIDPVAVRTLNSGSVILTVGALDGLIYQWQQDGEDLKGQTGTSLALYQLTSGDYGSYRVKVTNSLGTTTSDAVVLSSVPTAPDIALFQPSTTPVGNGATRDLGAVTLGSVVELVFTIRNTGTAALEDLTAGVMGRDEEDFSIPPSLPETLAAGETTTFTVIFSPASPGEKEAVLRVESSDADESLIQISLTGSAQDPVTLPAAPVPPVENPATGRQEQTITVNNTGTEGMGGVQIRIDGVPVGVTVVGGTYVEAGASSGGRVAKAPGGYWLVTYQPVIGAGFSAQVVVEYAFTGAPVAFTPQLAVAPVPAAGPADPAFHRAVRSFTAEPAAGRSSMEVNTVPGRRYEVWHSGNLTTWQRAGSIFSRSERLTWTDDGTSTGTPPTTGQPRFYRLLDVTE